MLTIKEKFKLQKEAIAMKDRLLDPKINIKEKFKLQKEYIELIDLLLDRVTKSLPHPLFSTIIKVAKVVNNEKATQKQFKAIEKDVKQLDKKNKELLDIPEYVDLLESMKEQIGRYSDAL